MSDFFAIATSFPTAILSLAVLAVSVYWVVSLVAGFGVDALDDFGDAGTGDADGFSGSFASFLHLDGVPLTVSVSLWMLLSWFVSFVFSTFLRSQDFPSSVHYVAGASFLLLSLVAGVFLASVFTRPLAKLFRSSPALGRDDLCGRAGVVTTGSVTPTFGQAEVALAGGGSSLVQVRCDEDPSPSLGDEVVLVTFDQERDAFLVTPLPQGFKL